jgi:nitrogenase molybdenum-cofactor synthesis protein NifE
MQAGENMNSILRERRPQVGVGGDSAPVACEKQSLAGTVSQRACVFCGSRVVLYPVTDALHLIHGPIGCAAYTWDIRGALSSGEQLHRNSFCTDLKETDVIYGGEQKLVDALRSLIDAVRPAAAFVYETCIVGLIGDDVGSVCKRVSAEKGIPVIPVESPGFAGSKKDGYRSACSALEQLVGTGDTAGTGSHSINILGDFNIAGETWIITDYYRRMGVEVVSTITGDGRVADISRAHGARLNVVQCSGSMIHLAKAMKEKYGIPYIRVSYFGIEDAARALYDVAEFFGESDIVNRTRTLVNDQIRRIMPDISAIRQDVRGKKAAVYTGGAFKAFSLIKSLRSLGMETALAGSQTGCAEDYEVLQRMCTPGTIIIDDATSAELAHFMATRDIDIFIGGVKERPIAYKLGVGFCDHNHERKIALAGFEGMLNFAREVRASVMSPVWQFVPRKRGNRRDAPIDPTTA